MTPPDRPSTGSPETLEPMQRFSSITPVTLGLLAAIALVSCEETTRARVSVLSTQPAAGATDVAADAPISATFSYEIEEGSVTASSFRVSGSRSGVHAGLFVLDEDGRRVLFLPTERFEPGEVVTVQITSGVTSTSGTPVSRFTFSFTIAGSPPVPDPGGDGDPVPTDGPRVVRTSPAAWAPSVPRDTRIEIELSSFLNPFTVTAASVHLDGSVSGPIPFVISAVLKEGDRIVLTPNHPFHPGEQITVRLDGSIRDTDGGELEGFAFSFRAGANAPPLGSIAPVVVGASGRPVRVRLADLDADGLAEILYISENGDRVHVLGMPRVAELESALELELGELVHSFELADLDHDGDLDLVVGLNLAVAVFYNVTPSGNTAALDFAVGPTRSTASTVRGIAAADLNHDGLVDLLLDTDRGIEILLDGPEGATATRIGDRRMARTRLVLEDLDRDGHLDLIYGDPRFPSLAYHLSHPSGSGALGDAIEVPLPADAAGVEVADLDGDGIAELVALLLSNPTATSPLYVSWFDVNTGFYEGVSTPPTATLLEEGSLVMADLDGDGRLEALVSAPEANRVLSFANPSTVDDLPAEILSALEPSSLAVGDLDGDGALDVVVASGNELRLRLSTLADDGPIDPPPVEPTLALHAGTVEARQGDTAVTVRVAMSNSTPVEGLTAQIAFDPLVVRQPRFELAGGILETAEFVDSRRVEGADAVRLSAIVDFLFPIVGTTLPAGLDQEIAHLVLDVATDAPIGDSPLRFVDDVGDPPVGNVFVVGGESLAPRTNDGAIRVAARDLDPVDRLGTLRVEVIESGRGATVRVPVTVSSEAPIDAFTVAASFDPATLTVLELDLTGSDSETFAPELVVPSIDPGGFLSLSVVFDLVPPFEGNTLPAGQDLVLFSIRARVADDAPTGLATLDLADGLGNPPQDNLLVDAGRSVFPRLVDGGIIVLEVSDPMFVRGDATGDGVVDATDSVAILDWIFGLGAEPGCLDAADANDDGTINVTDSTLVLDFTARGGTTPPAAPFPTPGVDPTEDALDCAEPLLP